MVVSIPGEMTAEAGRRVRHAVMQAASGAGVHRVVISGLANEYADYFTTPEEYDAQHYEGAATVYGRTSSVALQETLAKLAGGVANHRPAPQPYVYDPRNGVSDHAPPFSKGASKGKAANQPHSTARRLSHPTFAWFGGPKGLDRPLDRAFVQVQRRAGGRWRTMDSDLGLDILWTVDSNGVYHAEWEPPFDHRLGTYRFGVRANRYRLHSKRFRLLPSRKLTVRRVAASSGRAAVVLDYPKPAVQENVGDPAPDASASLTKRPSHARSGRVTFLVEGRRITRAASKGGRFVVHASPGDHITIRRGAARDQHGNANGAGLSFDA
jgi:neutral ceramidase